MPLPFKAQCGDVKIAVTPAGLALNGSEPRLDALVILWKILVASLSTEEINLIGTAGRAGHAKIVAEARAAMQVRSRGI